MNSGFHDEYGNEVPTYLVEGCDSTKDDYFTEDEEDEIGLPEIILALGSLTEKQRFVVECRYGLRPGMDGHRMSQRDIASLMGISQVAVLGIETRALQALRERLA